LTGNLLRSGFGSVHAYTRHTKTCTNGRADNRCKCPKWLYVWDAQTREKTRRTLNTPSWAEAQRIASETLRGMDPEIAAARQLVQKDETKTTVKAAMQLWMDRTARECGAESSIWAQYQTLTRKVITWADKNKLHYVDEITTPHLEIWYGSGDWTDLAKTTRAQRWGVLRSIFQFLANRGVIDKSPSASIERVKVPRGHVQGPYTDKQVQKILSSVEASIPKNLEVHRRNTYAPRIHAFLRLLIATGCDVSDAVQHTPDRIEHQKVGKATVHVYRYSRQKTDVGAVIPISEEVARVLKQVPLEAGCEPEMPFRTVGLRLKKDQKKWSWRIASVIEVAGVEKVSVPGHDEDGHAREKDANVKMFRHTFAVAQLKSG
jgi:site-specific recombinase XerD